VAFFHRQHRQVGYRKSIIGFRAATRFASDLSELDLHNVLQPLGVAEHRRCCPSCFRISISEVTQIDLGSGTLVIAKRVPKSRSNPDHEINAV
jgi:hypothetical protein